MIRDKATIRDKIIGLLKEGQPRKKIAKLLGVSYQTVRTIADGALEAGIIALYPGSYPYLYYEPGAERNGRYDVNHHTLMAEDLRVSRVHIAGFFQCDVIAVGKMEQVDHNGRIAVIWRSTPSRPKGRVDWYGSYRTDGQHISLCYRVGKTSQTFAIWAGDIQISGANAFDRGADLLRQRAEWVVSVLKKSGWRLTEPTLKGVVHSAHVDAPFIQLGKYDEDAPVQCDRSTGAPELEVFNNEDNDIVAYLPDHIRAIYERLDTSEDIANRLIGLYEKLAKILTDNATIATAGVTPQPQFTSDIAGVMYH